MFYRAIGFVVWKLALKYLRQRFGSYRKPALGLIVAGAIAFVYISTRGDE